MSGIAILNIAGDLSKHAEEKFFPDGRKYQELSIPISKGRDKPTTWYTVVVQGKLADSEKFASLLKKGAGVYVSGEHAFRTYEKKDGTTGFNNTVYASSITITKYAPDEGETTPEEDEQPF